MFYILSVSMLKLLVKEQTLSYPPSGPVRKPLPFSAVRAYIDWQDYESDHKLISLFTQILLQEQEITRSSVSVCVK